MMKKFVLMMTGILPGMIVLAQPAATQLKTDFVKNGVTGIEDVKTEKITYKDRAAWKLAFKTVQPVKPEEVEGKTGVTLRRNWEAVYECKGTNCRLTRQEQLGSEFNGMDIPAPVTDTLEKIVRKEMMSEPQRLVHTMQFKSSFDDVKTGEPAIDWINPKKLVFTAQLYYSEKKESEIISYQSPVKVTIERPDLKSGFVFSSATEAVERSRELGRRKLDVGTTKTDPNANKAPVAPVAGAWKKGDKVKVEENGKWYPATVLYAKTGEWFVHYDEYESSHDEWVAAPRIKNK